MINRFCYSERKSSFIVVLAFLSKSNQAVEKNVRRAFLRPEGVHKYSERAKKVRNNEEKGSALDVQTLFKII